MSKVKEPMCAKMVFTGYHGHPCLNRGKFAEGGKHWCGTHLPSKVEAARAVRRAEWDREWEEQQDMRARATRIEKAESALLAGVMELDPIPVGCEWLGKLIEGVRKAMAS